VLAILKNEALVRYEFLKLVFNFIILNSYLMKTIPFLALFAILILSSSYVSTVIATPQTEHTVSNDFNHFRIHRQGASVALSWAVAAPDVTHFIVERSFDEGEFFEPINQMRCSGNNTHKFNDAFVSGGVITYRIVAVKSDGTHVYSANETIRIVQRK
jgi:hypothetical protein